MSQLILAHVPPLHVVLMGLQRQMRWFRGGLLQLMEETAQIHIRPIRTASPTTPGGGAHRPFCQYMRPNVSVTLRLFVINQAHASATLHVKYT